MLYTDGKIIRWDDAKGFGFAQAKNTDKDIFVHISKFEPSEYRPVVNQQIRFILEVSEDGKLRAQSILLYGKKLQKKPKKRGLFVPLVLLAFIVFTIVAMVDFHCYLFFIITCIVMLLLCLL